MKINGLTACGRCGGTAVTPLSIGEKTAALCRDCEGEAGIVLNAFMLRQFVGPIPPGYSVALDDYINDPSATDRDLVEVNSYGFFF